MCIRDRLKRGGSPGGHNGLKSIDGQIGQNYLRVRAGIGHPRHQAPEGAARETSGGVVSHVLGPFKGKEAEEARILVDNCADAVEMMLQEGLDKAQMKFHALKPAAR